jgi:ribose transport system substrate-binding protein
VLTYAGADDVEFGRLQGKLVDQAFGGNKAKVAYVMGFAGTSPQILRAKGWDEFRAQHPQYEEVVRSTDDFDAAKALAVVQDLLSRFPKGQLDAIVMQGPEASAAVDFAQRNGRDEIKFIVGDYPEDVRQLISEGKIFGTVDQDPYPQAYSAMKMAWLHFNGKDSDIPKPYFLPLPLITKENAEKTPAAWGC